MNVNLREWDLTDAGDLTAAINNPKVLENLRDGVPYPYTEKDAEEFITATLSAEKDSLYAFAITYEGKAIGSIGVFRKEGVHRFTAEMGYYIAEPYWGKGIMTEAVRQICDYVFTNTDIVRIFAEPYAFNDASCRVLEKARFQFEGTLRKNVVKNGQMLDMKLYSILRESTLKLLCENEFYTITSEYEVTILFDKTTENSTVIGDHYGDPQAAIISEDNKFCVSVGCGAIIYYLKPPFDDYKNVKNSQWLNVMTEGKTFFETVTQLDMKTVLINGGDGLMVQLNVYTGDIAVISNKN